MFTIHKFKSLSSTNIEAKEYPANSVIIADSQTSGKGRFKRKWKSQEGGIYLSIVVEPVNENLGILTFLTALAVNKTIHEMFKIKTEIKWPNDVLFNGKKLCGILTENIISGNSRRMIIGIGINLNNNIPRGINAISISRILKRNIAKERFISELIRNFEWYYNGHYIKKKFSSIIIRFKKQCSTLGKKVEIKTINENIHGTATGIGKDCSLIIKAQDGKTRKIYEGDIFHIQR